LVLILLHTVFGATVKDLLGDRVALQCYADGRDVRCHNLQAGDDWKVFTRSAATSESWPGSINRDGAKLACVDGDEGCVVNLDGTHHQIVTDTISWSQCFYRDGNGDDWIVYIKGKVNKGQSGETWKVKIDRETNAPIEATRAKIVDYQYHGGITGNGRYLGTTYRHAYIYNIETGTKSVHLNGSQNCVGTINAGNEPWLFYEKEPTHHDVVVSEWGDFPWVIPETAEDNVTSLTTQKAMIRIRDYSDGTYNDQSDGCFSITE